MRFARGCGKFAAIAATPLQYASAEDSPPPHLLSHIKADFKTGTTSFCTQLSKMMPINKNIIDSFITWSGRRQNHPP